MCCGFDLFAHQELRKHSGVSSEVEKYKQRVCSNWGGGGGMEGMQLLGRGHGGYAVIGEGGGGMEG